MKRKMRILLETVCMLMVTVCASCNDSETTEKPEAKIVQFALKCGDTYQQGEIDEENRMICLANITSRKTITGVNYQLSKGARISPDPKKVRRWETEQRFIVTSSDKRSTSQYTLLLPDLQDEPEENTKVVIGYIPAHEFNAQLNNIHWEYLTHINLSSVHVKKDGTLNTGSVAESKLKQIRAKAKEYGVKVLVSFSKNGNSEFATAISNEATRNKLVSNIINYTKNYHLDGFDIDFEDYNYWDSKSLIAFAKALHEAKSDNMLMTCAVVCWLDYTVKWHEYFDYINIMSYDKLGGDKTVPKQHASYNDFVSDLKKWVNNFQAPKSKIVGGLPFYGYAWDEDINKDDVGAVRFNAILNHFGQTNHVEDVADADHFGKTYYNGRTTIRKKCQYVMDNDFGGVMIWQLFQDAYQEDLKLIKVIGEVMIQK